MRSSTTCNCLRCLVEAFADGVPFIPVVSMTYCYVMSPCGWVCSGLLPTHPRPHRQQAIYTERLGFGTKHVKPIWISGPKPALVSFATKSLFSPGMGYPELSDDIKVTRNRLSVGPVYPVITNRTCLWRMTRCLIEEVKTESVSIPRDLEE